MRSLTFWCEDTTLEASEVWVHSGGAVDRSALQLRGEVHVGGLRHIEGRLRQQCSSGCDKEEEHRRYAVRLEQLHTMQDLVGQQGTIICATRRMQSAQKIHKFPRLGGEHVSQRFRRLREGGCRGCILYSAVRVSARRIHVST